MLCNILLSRSRIGKILFLGVLSLGWIASSESSALAAGKGRYQEKKTPNWTLVDQSSDAYPHSFKPGLSDKVVIRVSKLRHAGEPLAGGLRLVFHMEACLGKMDQNPVDNPDCLTWNQMQPIEVGAIRESGGMADLNTQVIEIPLSELFDRLPRSGRYPEVGFHFYLDVVDASSQTYALQELNERMLKFSDFEAGKLLFDRPYLIQTNMDRNSNGKSLPDILEYSVEFKRGGQSGKPIALNFSPSIPPVSSMLEALVKALQENRYDMRQDFSRRRHEAEEGNFLIVPGLVNLVINGIDEWKTVGSLNAKIEDYQNLTKVVKEQELGQSGPALSEMVREINEQFPAKANVPNESAQVAKLIGQAIQNGVIAHPSWVQLDAVGPVQFISGRAALVKWIADRL